jgi:hypothetical protein
VFVLQGTGREFVEQLSRSKAANGLSAPSQDGHAVPHHAAPPSTRSDVATLPTTELTR